MDKLKLLKTVSVFNGMPDEVLKIIAEQMKKLTFHAGAKIFSDGDLADSFYIVETGDVTISKNLSGGRRKVLAEVKTGEVFGEMAFFSDSPRIASANAKTDCVLWQIGHRDFFGVITKYPEVGLKVFSALLHVAMGRLEQTGRELATVYETGRIISSGKPLLEIITALSDELLVAVSSAEKSAIFVYNEFNMEFESPSYGEVDAKDPFVSKLTEEKSNILINAKAETGLQLPEYLKNAVSAITVPIPKSLGEGALPDGFISLWSETRPAAFNNSHLLLLNSVAGQLSAALENIRHIEEEKNRQRLGQSKQSY